MGNQITLFSVPKPFDTPHINIIQRNAIKSWMLMRPQPEILLMGEDNGVAEIAEEFNLQHIPKVPRIAHDMLSLSYIFKTAQEKASNDTVVYINTDTILLDDFIPAVDQVKCSFDQFLLVGRRWGVNITAPIDFKSGWEEHLRNFTRPRGSVPRLNCEYFAFNRGLIENMPEFGLGHFCWDGWLQGYVRDCLKVPMIDATQVIFAVHQNHPIMRELGVHPGAKHNRQLMGGWQAWPYQSPYKLTEKGIMAYRNKTWVTM